MSNLAVAVEVAVASIVIVAVAPAEGRKLDLHWTKHHAQINRSDVLGTDPMLPP